MLARILAGAEFSGSSDALAPPPADLVPALLLGNAPVSLRVGVLPALPPLRRAPPLSPEAPPPRFWYVQQCSPTLVLVIVSSAAMMSGQSDRAILANAHDDRICRSASLLSMPSHRQTPSHALAVCFALFCFFVYKRRGSE